MSLRVWLPLTGDLHNQGLDPVEVINNGATIDNSGKIGQCYYFNGSSYINVVGLDINNSWSYGCWFKEAASSRSWEGMIILNNNGGDADMQFGFYTYPTGSRCQTTANGQYNGGAHTFDNKWHHLFATFDGSSLKTYRDGTLINTKSITASMLKRSNLTLGARRRASSYDCYWKGYMNDFRVYDHCLSQKEVKEISKGLILHYPLTNELLGYSSPNLVEDYMLQTANWTYSISSWTTYEGEYCMIVNPQRLYSKTSSGTLPLLPDITFKPNKRYLLTIKWRDDYRTDGKTTGFVIGFRYTDGTETTIKSSSYSGITTQWVTSTVTSSSGKSVDFVRCSYGNSGYMYVAWIKIEELNNIDLLETYKDLTGWTKENSISVTYDSEIEMYKVLDSSHTSSRWGIYRNVPLKPNTKYIFSFWGYKVDQGCGYSFGQGISGFPGANAISATTKTYYSKVVTTTETAENGRVYLYVNPVSEGTNYAYFSEPRLEECIEDISTPNIYQNNTLGINDTIVQDCSGYGRHGTLYSDGTLLTYVRDQSIRNSTCLYWGSQTSCSNYVISPSIYLPGDQITMNLWIKSLNGIAGASNYHIPLCISDDYYEFSISNGGAFRGGLRIGETRYVENCANPSILDKKWHMITMTYDGTTIRRYVDGVEYKSNTVTGSLRSGAYPLRLGRFSSTTYYNKQLFESDARIYTTALSQEDILELYQMYFLIDNKNNLYAYEVTEIE